jgi:O-antigen/teichoic acid export membrane protein
MYIFKNSIFRSASLLTLSQILALLVSAMLIMILPKFISVTDYGYWQLFILYSGYVGLFHFGYSDGLYITLGGKNLKILNVSEIKQHFTIFLIFQLLFSATILLYSLYCFQDFNKLYVFIAISVFLLIENYHKLISFVLLATSNSSSYAKSVIIDKILTVIFLLSAVGFHQLSFKLVIVIYIICRLISLIYLMVFYKIFFPSLTNWEQFSIGLKKVIANCKLGIILTISNILGTLILASGRLVVECSWSITSFAQISLAVSLAFFIMSLISQVSLLLFPILCNAEDNIRKKILKDGSIVIGFISILGFIFYFVTYAFIKFWLPAYTESLKYLIYLFPIVLFENKTQILYTTYCKSINKLRLLLNVNIVVIIIAVILYYVAAKIHSIDLVLVTMFAALMVRSIILNLFLYKHFNLKIDKYFYLEIIFSVTFILVNKYFGTQILFYFFLIALVGFFIIYIKDLKSIYFTFKNRRNEI